MLGERLGDDSDGRTGRYVAEVVSGANGRIVTTFAVGVAAGVAFVVDELLKGVA